MSAKPTTALEDLEDRDPHGLGEHLQVSWEEVIGEPDKIRSPECAWRVSHHCFQISKNVCYTFLSVLCAPISACCLGCTFACIAFEHIWCVIPCIRIWKITCAAIKIFVTAIAHAIIAPIAEALGLLCSGIKVTTHNVPEKMDKKQDVLLI